MTDDSDKRPTERPVPRVLAGWPEGSVYVPRQPILMRDFLAAEREELLFVKHRRYSRTDRHTARDSDEQRQGATPSAARIAEGRVARSY